MWPTVIITMVVILILSAMVGLAVFSIIRDKKKGKCSCGNSCSSCAMHGECHKK